MIYWTKDVSGPQRPHGRNNTVGANGIHTVIFLFFPQIGHIVITELSFFISQNYSVLQNSH